MPVVCEKEHSAGRAPLPSSSYLALRCYTMRCNATRLGSTRLDLRLL